MRDVFGWSLPFPPGLLPEGLEAPLRVAGLLSERGDGLLQAEVRVARVRGNLFLHSAYPTTAPDSVFLGPDSYRFADLIVARMGEQVGSILDYGAGAGVGGISAATAARGARLDLADVSPRALELAAVNAGQAGIEARMLRVSTPADIAGGYDLVVTHPPFMIDADARAYRDGGGLHGTRLSLDWALEAATLLDPGGRLVLHTGVAIVDGVDPLKARLEVALRERDLKLSYAELDPDIFGEELAGPAYAEVDRIAAVGAVIERPR